MALKRIVTGDPNLQTIQDAISQALTAFAASPFQKGMLLTGISLSSGSTQVAHRLGRTPRGWVVVDTTAAGTIYRTGSDARYLTLQSSAAATVSLWVF